MGKMNYQEVKDRRMINGVLWYSTSLEFMKFPVSIGIVQIEAGIHGTDGVQCEQERWQLSILYISRSINSTGNLDIFFQWQWQIIILWMVCSFLQVSILSFAVVPHTTVLFIWCCIPIRKRQCLSRCSVSSRMRIVVCYTCISTPIRTNSCISTDSHMFICNLVGSI